MAVRGICPPFSLSELWRCFTDVGMARNLLATFSARVVNDNIYFAFAGLPERFAPPEGEALLIWQKGGEFNEMTSRLSPNSG